MQSRLSKVMIAAALLGVCASISGAHADAFLKQIRHTDGFQAMGQQVPARTDTLQLWFGDQHARIDTGQESTVLLISGEEVIYLIDHLKRTYAELPLDGQGMMDAMGLGNEEDAEAMKGMIANMMANTKVTVTPTEERKRIRDWNARQYVVETQMPMGSTRSEIWASEEIKVDPAIFQKLSGAAAGWVMGMDAMLKEMQKIKGMEVLNVSEASMMGANVKSTTELIEYAEKPAPAGTFVLPDGYSKKALMEQ